jgi:putative membrane protein
MMLHGLPAFLESFAASMVLFGAFLALYTLVLPMKEWHLIRQGNTAAAVLVGGAMIGFSLPLAEAVRQSAGFSDMVIWSGVALLVQLLAFGGMRLARRDAAAAIEQGDMAEAVFLAAASVALGVINAACLS